MMIDHIFIASQQQGKDAEQLVNLGFIEGSSRVHKGQGTTNRKFYFNNFFLEIIWVHDEQELCHERNKQMGLADRIANSIQLAGNVDANVTGKVSDYPNNRYNPVDDNFDANNISPFGLCLVNDDSSHGLFADAVKYQPDYFPANMPISIIKNQHQACLPYTFRLPFKSSINQNKIQNDEPKQDGTKALGIKALTQAVFEYNQPIEDAYLDFFTDATQIIMRQSNRIWLTLTFDYAKSNTVKHIDSLRLTLRY